MARLIYFLSIYYMKHKSSDYKLSACGYWNRDVNGSTNIYKIAYNAINNKERPDYLSRSNNLSGSLDELPKPKFTRSVKGKPY